jgi:hypothetical protein
MIANMQTCSGITTVDNGGVGKLAPMTCIGA